MDKNYMPLKLTKKDIDFFTKRKYGAHYFATHAVAYLRDKKHLMKNYDYCCLYDELLNFLIDYAIENCGWKKDDLGNRKQMEFMVDIFSKHPPYNFEHFDDDFMNQYLDYRRLVWDN